MRVGFFTNTYLPISYGSVNSVEYFRKGLEFLGHEVFIFAPRFWGYEDSSKNVFRYPSIQWKYKIEYPVGISVWPPMNKKVKKLGLDIIHSHQPFSIGKDGLRQAKRNGIPIVFTHHCRYEDYIHYVPPIVTENFLKNHVKSKATEFANNCDQVIAPSQKIKDLIQERGVKTPVEVLPTGIDWERYQKANGERIREKYGIGKGEILFLNIGRIEAEKNIEFLFEMVMDILKKYENTKFLMAGEGSLRRKLMEQARENGLEKRAFFPGLVSQTEVADYYKAGDIFLHTSKSETQGMTINEAMATATPSVAIRATGPVDMIDNNINGMLTEDSKEDFLKSVESLIKDETLRKGLGQAALEKSKGYDYKTQARKIEAIYKKLIACN